MTFASQLRGLFFPSEGRRDLRVMRILLPGPCALGLRAVGWEGACV